MKDQTPEWPGWPLKVAALSARSWTIGCSKQGATWVLLARERIAPALRERHVALAALPAIAREGRGQGSDYLLYETWLAPVTCFSGEEQKTKIQEYKPYDINSACHHLSPSHLPAGGRLLRVVGHDLAARVSEADAVDGRLAHERRRVCPRRQLPHFCAAIAAACYQLGPVDAVQKSEACDLGAMRLEGQHGLAAGPGLGGPQLDGLQGAPRA